jgi:hypothetical protein
MQTLEKAIVNLRATLSSGNSANQTKEHTAKPTGGLLLRKSVLSRHLSRPNEIFVWTTGPSALDTANDPRHVAVPETFRHLRECAC